jgi:hypothetical protein
MTRVIFKRGTAEQAGLWSQAMESCYGVGLRQWAKELGASRDWPKDIAAQFNGSIQRVSSMPQFNASMASITAAARLIA